MAIPKNRRVAVISERRFRGTEQQILLADIVKAANDLRFIHLDGVSVVRAVAHVGLSAANRAAVKWRR